MISVKIYTCYKKNLKSKWFLNLTLSDNYISLHVYKKIKWLYKKIKINTKHQKKVSFIMFILKFIMYNVYVDSEQTDVYFLVYFFQNN